MDILDSDASPAPIVDYLENDEPIRGQAFACLSFLLPEKCLANKEIYYVSKFLHQIGTDLTQLIHFLKDKYPDDVDALDRFLESYSHINDFHQLQDYYTSFCSVNGSVFDDEFAKQNNFQTNTRGIKVRGVYSTIDEATRRANQLKVRDPLHNVWVGEVGAWLPISDNPDEVQNAEYSNNVLGELMKRYTENMERRTEVFNDRVMKLAKKVVGSRLSPDDGPSAGAGDGGGIVHFEVIKGTLTEDVASTSADVASTSADVASTSADVAV